MSDNLISRQVAIRALNRLWTTDQTLETVLDRDPAFIGLSAPDRAFVRLSVLTVLRRRGQIDAVLKRLMRRPLGPKQQTVHTILRLAMGQHLFLQTPMYACVNTAVALTRQNHFEGLTGLVNGVLRAFGRLEMPLEGLENPVLNLPAWIRMAWEQAYGVETTAACARACMEQPPLDITVRDEAELWARKWQGTVLPTGGVRVSVSSPLDLAGFQTGPCLVQNGAASVPARLFTNVQDKCVADLCAAPGGKTVQLAWRGARVRAYDISAKRLERLHENLERLGLRGQVQTNVADVMTWTPETLFDAVLLDAPCSATGTIARHPEILYHRTQAAVVRLAAVQREMLNKAVRMTKPGGEIVFSTCSLQPEEGDEVVRALGDRVQVIRPADRRWNPYLTPFGSLRFLPTMGFDGFYACLLRRV